MKILQISKKSLSLRSFFLTLALLSSTSHADCGKVIITKMNWASAAFVTNVSKFLMEQGYGCDVTVVPSSTVPALTSLAETGEPHIVTEIWSTSAPVVYELEKQGKVVIAANVISDGGERGFYIPKYLAERHPELKTMEGILENPKLVNGLFHNCPEGWGCRIINDHLAEALDFKGHQIKTFNHGSSETLATSLVSAYNNKEPWLGFYWGPTAILGKYEMTHVDLGPYHKEIHECNAQADCQTPGVSSFPSAAVLTAVTTEFSKNNPEVYKLMTHISFSSDTINKLLAWQEINKASAEETAVHFITTQSDIWSTWINEEAIHNLSSLIK
ncbi:ABC transporter substrate-binding protein [Amphritea sp. 1_MG-2023]|uniref:ABC transporter substrate-binding protein n=1 Tax=Amphritea sp. 1_MG-2023 TaxID=3062670 RepID=UPI0026E11B1F|nr:ABC transporter substrate-binding protein [Amphritea sp. 1_MG-2023]MDO6563540.1 ABC transporter substrate-binding protein [Amphritea sp. 1_MG-2023]